MKLSYFCLLSYLLAISVLVTLFLLTIYMNKPHPKNSFGVLFRDPSVDGNVLFNGFNNVTGASIPIVPDLVHFVLFGKEELDFITFLCMMAALKIHRPKQLIVHTDTENGTVRGLYWNQLLLTASKMKSENNTEDHFDTPKVKAVFIRRPTHVYGQLLSSVWHASDVTRLLLLQQHGGIFLDGDSLILQPLTTFRHFEMAIGWPENAYIGTQVIVAHQKARMLQYWLEGYRLYKPHLWYYNAGQLPTQQILLNYPYLVHRVPVLFGVHNLAERLYSTSENNSDFPWWQKEGFYAVHLLSRHRNYLTKYLENINNTVDEYSVLNDKTSFGEIARWVLYHVEPKLPNPPWVKNG